MEMLGRFIGICLRRPAEILEDCLNRDYVDVSLKDLLCLPVLFLISFATTVFYLVRESRVEPPLDGPISNPPSPVVNEGGDFTVMDENDEEDFLPWQYQEDYPSPY